MLNKNNWLPPRDNPQNPVPPAHLWQRCSPTSPCALGSLHSFPAPCPVPPVPALFDVPPVPSIFSLVQASLSVSLLCDPCPTQIQYQELSANQLIKLPTFVNKCIWQRKSAN